MRMESARRSAAGLTDYRLFRNQKKRSEKLRFFSAGEKYGGHFQQIIFVVHRAKEKKYSKRLDVGKARKKTR